MGFSEAYATVRSNILMISPLPSVSLAYSLLIQDEKQRERYVSSYRAGNNSSYLVVDGNAPPQYPVHGNKSQTPKYKNKRGNSSLIFFHCRKVGHSIDKFYRITGFSSDFKFTKIKRDPNTIRSNIMIPSDLPCFPSSLHNFVGIAGNQLTQEQVHQLVHLLNQSKVTQPDANPIDQNAMTACADNYSVSCLLSFNSKPRILDSGASQNMFSDSNMFHALESLPQPSMLHYLIPLM